MKNSLQNMLSGKGGYSLIEVIIYVGILTLVSIVVLNLLFSFTQSYKTLAALRAVEHSAIDAMERMTREIRASTAVVVAQSTFGSSPGVLTISSNSSGISKTVKFYLDSGILKMDIDGSYFGPLTSSNTTVSSLTFYNLTSTNSSAVKLDMTVSATVSDVTQTKIYHTTVVLKEK